MFPGSAFYGIRSILLKYAGLPKFLPIPVAVQHGWQRFAHTFEASARPPEIWVWSNRIKKELAQHYPEDKIRVVGSFFDYLLINISDSVTTSDKTGSICIPPHSSHFAKTEYPIEEFIKQLKELGDEYKPITVMLYYLDMSDETVSTYTSNGFKVVSNGSLFNDNFLCNFVKNVQDKRFCLYSELGSGVFYASRLGAEVRHFDIPCQAINHGNVHLSEEIFKLSKEFDEDIISKLSLDFIKDEMGVEYIMSRAEMRRCLLRNYLTLSFFYQLLRFFVGSVLRFLRIRKGVALD
jgi:hypothetical protein